MKVLKNIRSMDLILFFIAILLIAFTVKMIDLYEKTYAIPDTLCTCVFGCLGGECGAMAWIKTTKIRKEDRKWQLEDYERMKEELKNAESH